MTIQETSSGMDTRKSTGSDIGKSFWLSLYSYLFQNFLLEACLNNS